MSPQHPRFTGLSIKGGWGACLRTPAGTRQAHGPPSHPPGATWPSPPRAPPAHVTVYRTRYAGLRSALSPKSPGQELRRCSQSSGLTRDELCFSDPGSWSGGEDMHTSPGRPCWGESGCTCSLRRPSVLPGLGAWSSPGTSHPFAPFTPPITCPAGAQLPGFLSFVLALSALISCNFLSQCHRR